MTKHEHTWIMSDFVIDTLPPTYTWSCECGADSHDGGKTLCKIHHYGRAVTSPQAKEPKND